jgi:hypothetical protein
MTCMRVVVISGIGSGMESEVVLQSVALSLSYGTTTSSPAVTSHQRSDSNPMFAAAALWSSVKTIKKLNEE